MDFAQLLYFTGFKRAYRRGFLKKSILFFTITVVLLLIGFACDEPDHDVIEDRYCSFYRPDYSTIKIEFEYKYFDIVSPVQTAVIKLYNWSPDGKLIVNNLDGGELLINGQETEFKDSLGVEGFYPKNHDFSLVPGTNYTITLEHDTSLYEFETRVPEKLDDLGIADVVNMASDLYLRLNTANNYFANTTIRLSAYDPENHSDSILLINNEVYNGNGIYVPFQFMAPALNGWEAELYIRRIDEGYYDLSFINDSKVTGTCSYYKKFGLTYSKKQ